MKSMKCPGQDLSRKTPGEVLHLVNCPHCGYEVEFFFDDKSRICSHCGKKLEKSDQRLLKDFGCASWCTAAEDCLGPQLYAKFNGARKRLGDEKKRDLEHLLDSIPDDEVEIKIFFIQAFKENSDLELLINPEKSIKPLEKRNPGLYEKVVKRYSEYTKSRGASQE